MQLQEMLNSYILGFEFTIQLVLHQLAFYQCLPYPGFSSYIAERVIGEL